MLLSGWADKNRLNSESQRVVVNGSCFTWRPVTTAVVQGSTILGPSLVYSFISDLKEAIERTLKRCAGDTKLGGPVSTVTRARLPAAGWRNGVTETL